MLHCQVELVALPSKGITQTTPEIRTSSPRSCCDNNGKGNERNEHDDDSLRNESVGEMAVDVSEEAVGVARHRVK